MGEQVSLWVLALSPHWLSLSAYRYIVIGDNETDILKLFAEPSQ